MSIYHQFQHEEFLFEGNFNDIDKIQIIRENTNTELKGREVFVTLIS